MVSTTRISPITVITVVEVVGVIPNAQTSSGCPVHKQISDSRANGLSAFPVITIFQRWVQRMSQLCEFHYFAGLTGIRNQQQQIILLQYAQVSVLCFAGMQKYRRNAGRTKCGSNIHSYLSGFSHSGSHQFTPFVMYLLNNQSYSLLISIRNRNISASFCNNSCIDVIISNRDIYFNSSVSSSRLSATA